MTITEISQRIDKIYITEKDFRKIYEWLKVHLIKTEDNPNTTDVMDKRMFFPLKTFVIDITMPRNHKLKALVELDSFNPVSSGRIQTDTYWFTYKRDYIKRGFQFDGAGCTEREVQDAHAYIIGILIYICNADRTMEFRPMIERTKAQGEYNPYEYQNRVCFLLDDIIKYAGTHKTRKSIQYQCECWGVRGHLRHYSDGRVIFIEPYKKGRLRDTLEPKNKTYMLTTGSEVKA